MNSRSSFHKTALALVALALLATGAAWGQVTAPEAYANDGAFQNAQGGWTIPFDYCGLDAVELAGLTTQTACETAGWNWDEEALTGSQCFYNRFECNARIFYAEDEDNPGTGDALIGTVGVYSDATLCTGPEREFVATACDDVGYRNETDCESGGHNWYANVCRGKFQWDASYNFVTTSGAPGYYAECTKCHNNRHYPDVKGAHHYHGAFRSVGEEYVMTGHKNMQRPAAPTGSLDPHYLVGTPWLDKTGVEIATDSSGNPINWGTGLINVVGVDKQLFWIYDWMDAAPRSAKDGDSYSCARCHSTGWENAAANETVKQPYVMFGDADPGTGNTTGSWDQFGIQCSRCHGSKPASATSSQRHHPTDVGTGANVLALCMDCHRQETSNLPYDSNDPAGVIKVGSAHGHLGIVSHYTGNQLLNSPHAKFTGTFAEINDETKYESHFTSYDWDVLDGVEGEITHVAGTGGGCTTCHDVHKSSLPDANPAGGFIHEGAECTSCHPKSLAVMLHPGGKDTPLEEMGVNPNAACESCHMPEGDHFFRINVDASYSTFPLAVMTPSATLSNANTAPDADGYPAVWVDLDKACGQCHGGGNEYKLTSGSMTSGSGVLTVADPAGFVKGQQVGIAGAGAAGADLHGYIAEVAGNNVTLVLATAGTTVAGAEVQLNPPAEGIGYISKANLAAYAKGIHNDAPKVNFTYTLDGADTLTALFNAGATTCNGSPANCNRFDWDFGDGQTGTGIAPSHTFPGAGSYTVTLTVTQYGMQPGSKSKIVTTYVPDYPPTVESTCEWDADTWTMTLIDASSDDHGIKQTAVTWGDGSLTSVGGQGTVFTHTYTKAGTFTVTEKVADTKGQIATFVCNPAPTAAYFSITGEVFASNGTTPLSNAKVQLLKDGTTLVKTVYTNINGVFVAGSLKPGSYTPIVTRTGYSFPAVAPVVVGPSTAIPDVVAVP